MDTKKYVYLFSEGRADMKYLLGGKGANLAEMTNLSLPVPPGVTITCEACNEYLAQGQEFPEGLQDQLEEKIAEVEKEMGKEFGDRDNPLLVSVRSGSPMSMPGMMDTILNLGLNDETVNSLAEATGDRRFALDCYRRFIQMFGEVVLDIENAEFEQELEKARDLRGVTQDYELKAEELEKVVEDYKAIIKRRAGFDFPQDPKEQLNMAIRAVFNSWNNQRAVVYRRYNKIPDHLGTAVNIQSMVFGNMGDDCGTGVAFTRNPSTGENVIYGEFLVNAQGEDVVAGIRTPLSIHSLGERIPRVYDQLEDICRTLENHYKDMQDIEFTIERGKLYILQTRKGKRTAAASIKIAVDMVGEGLIDKQEALMRIEPNQLEQLLHRCVDPEAKKNVIAKGLPASPGAACGKVVFCADEAEKKGDEGESVILVRPETTPDDIHGIVASKGILTSRGGMTSHAAVVARGMGKPCVAGCDSIKIDLAAGKIIVNGQEIKEGEMLSIDGVTGEVIAGEVVTIEPQLSEEFQTLLSWADEVRDLEVRANADTPQDAAKAKEFGAAGIGLCRTEHMFMAQDRLPLVQKMILSGDEDHRAQALKKLVPLQEGDFYEILKAMQGDPVCIRLLDPPLHEFLPNAEDLLVELTEMRVRGGCETEIKEKEELLKQIKDLSETNPMLGHRGCRLGITFPEIYAMQVRAIFSAVIKLTEEGCEVYPEVEIPLVMDRSEFQYLQQMIEEIARELKQKCGTNFSYSLGTMIEIPRACATAEEIAENADFFSFGTNDLTQTTLGFSRDDAEGKFLQHYLNEKILPDNPFIVLDRKGVGKLMKMAVESGRHSKPDLIVGICGEHGGEPQSISFCHELGMDFVSCSPYRVPIARLAAAQAALKNKC